MDPDLAIAIRLLLAIGISAGLTCILGRGLLRLGWRGAGIVGGISAGFALGPMILGEFSPRTYQSLNIGAELESADLAQAVLDAQQAERALTDVGVSPSAIREQQQADLVRIEALQLARDRELERFRTLPLVFGASAAMLVLLAGMRLHRPVGLAGAEVGAAASVITCLFWAVALRQFIGASLSEAVILGSIASAGTVFARGRWRWAFGLGALTASGGLLVVGGAWPMVVLAAAAILVGLLLVWAVPIGPKRTRWWALATHGVLVPTSIALVLSQCDLQPGLGPMVLILLAGALGADVSLLSTWLAIGWLDRTRRRRAPASAWLGVYGQGWTATMMALLSLGAVTGAVDLGSAAGSAGALAIAVHAGTFEITKPMTSRSMARLRAMRRGPIRP